MYDGKTRAAITKLAKKNGLSRATELVGKKPGNNVTKSTVQSIRNVYRRHLTTSKTDPTLMEVPIKSRGSPLSLGPELDAKVVTYLTAIHNNGGVVNHKIAMACALAIVREHQPPLLSGS